MKKFFFIFVLPVCFYAQGELVNRDTFFEHVMGIQEDVFQTNNTYKKEAISWNEHENSFFLKNKSTDKLFRAGKFTVLSIGKLRELTSSASSSTPGSFNVIEALSPLGKSYYKYVDIGANQADIQNRDAVFQIASNFNTLELTSSGDSMSNIVGYVYDTTQGPFASISAAPGLILRHYYMFYNSNTNPIAWQQYAIIGRLWQKNDALKQLNLLGNTDIPIVNSYVSFAYREPEDVNNFSVKNIQVGWHERIQVTSGFMPNTSKHTLIDNPQQIINQVFTAAVDFGSNFTYKGSPKAIQIAQAIQDTAYEGTIRVAYAYGKKKVILTLIGGGVFANELAWIAFAIEKMEQFITESGLDVTLIIFDGNNYKSTKIKLFRKRMQQLTRKTGGQYIQYSDSHPNGQLLVEKTTKIPVAPTGNLTNSLQTLTETLYDLEKTLNR